MASKAAIKEKRESRAVVRLIEAGSQVECWTCEVLLKFRARQRDEQVICNVYEDGVWQRVEHFHPDCYDEVGRPYGDAEQAPSRRRSS